MRIHFGMFLFATLCAGFAAGREVAVDLSGEWRLTGTDAAGKPMTCPAQVPGDVHSALLAAGKIPDPFFGANETNVQWVGERDWTFSLDFTPPPEVLSAPSAILRLEDVDTFATIFLNGVALGSASNRFRRWEFDAKPFLRPGTNRLEGVFKSALRVAEAMSAASPAPYRYPNGTVPAINLVRKPQCHGGWDWGITQMTAGFCGDVKLIACDDFRVDYITYEQRFNADLSHCDLVALAEITGADGSRGVVTNSFSIAKPRLWWPNGMGGQNFHELALDVKGRKIPVRVAIRKVELVNEEGAIPGGEEDGLSFEFRVNGRPVFVRGANWIPCDAFESRQEAKLRGLLESAAAANMNMVRVWGGGQYEREAFYDACDELGLLVWQDFMFACANYPDGDFLENVRAEAAHQIRRLQRHPSVALWCGDNECRAIWRRASDAGAALRAYRERIDMLRALVARHAPGCAFCPGSPCNGPRDDMDGPNHPHRGDIHYWGVWHGGQPFRSFGEVTPRFCSEFGFQSYPSREVCLSFCRPEDMSLASPIFNHHQKNAGGNKRIRDTMHRYFSDPVDFDAMLYLSQVQQALAIKTAVELWRSRSPVCRGVLYWQLNDNWPVASWSSLEYGGKWKHLHYHARRFYSNVAVLPTENPWNERRYALAVANDGPADVTAELVVEPWSFDGTAPRADAPSDQYLKETVTVAAGQVKRLGHRWGDHGFYAIRFGDAENVWFSAPFKECPLATANVRVDGLHETAEGGRRAFEMTVSTDRPAFFVWLSAAGVPGEFSDNSFTMLPGRPRRITFVPRDAAPSLAAFRAALGVTHLQRNCGGPAAPSAPAGKGGERSQGLKALGLDV